MTGAFEPEQFGRYLLVDRIAAGGMAEIFNAKVFGAAGFEKNLVIKRILPQYAQDKQFVRMFVTEAKLVCNLNHPNIVQVLELGETNGQYYIAMERVDGLDAKTIWRTLAKRGQRMPVQLACYITSEFLKGLDYAHQAIAPDGKTLGVVHRDVTPSNILISHLGAVKISDFGIALVSEEAKSRSGALKGKYGYMTPEQLSGQTVDHRSDIFSAGVVLTELMMGRRLFRGQNDFETMRNVINVRLDVLGEHEQQLPVEAVQIARRALQRNPGERYHAAGDFQDEIEAYLHTEEVRITSRSLAAFLSGYVVPYVETPTAQLEPTPEGAAETDSVPDLGHVIKSDVLDVQSVAEPADDVPDTDEQQELEEQTEDTLDDDDDELTDDRPTPVRYADQDLPVVDAPVHSPEGEPAWESVPVFSPADSHLDALEAEQVQAAVGMDQRQRLVTSPEAASILASSKLASAKTKQIEFRPEFHGALGNRTLAKVLARFSASGESGLLVLTGPPMSRLEEILHDNPSLLVSAQEQMTCQIHLDGGRPDLVTADRSEAILAAYLLQVGKLNKDTLAEASEANPTLEPISALLATGYLTPLQVSRQVSAFVQWSVHNTFTWHRGDFAFYRERECTADAFPLGISVLALIRKGIAQILEQDLDRYFERLVGYHITVNRTPSFHIDQAKPGELLLAIYRRLAADGPVDQALEGCLQFGAPLKVKQALYFLIECEFADLD